MLQQFLSRVSRKSQGNCCLFEKSFLPFKLYATYPQEKTNHKESHDYLTDLQYFTFLLKKCPRLQHLSQGVDLWRPVKSLTSPLVNVCNKLSTTTLRFPDSSSMDTTISKSSKFPMLTISIPTFCERKFASLAPSKKCNSNCKLQANVNQR